MEELTASPPGPSMGGQREVSHWQELSRGRKGFVAAARERRDARMVVYFIFLYLDSCVEYAKTIKTKDKKGKKLKECVGD